MTIRHSFACPNRVDGTSIVSSKGKAMEDQAGVIKCTNNSRRIFLKAAGVAGVGLALLDSETMLLAAKPSKQETTGAGGSHQMYQQQSAHLLESSRRRRRWARTSRQRDHAVGGKTLEAGNNRSKVNESSESKNDSYCADRIPERLHHHRRRVS